MSVLIAIAKSIQLEDLKLLSTSQNLFRTSELVVTTSKVYFSTSSIRKYWIPWCKNLCWISKRPKSSDITDGLLLKIILYNMPHMICQHIAKGKISIAYIEVGDTVTDVLLESLSCVWPIWLFGSPTYSFWRCKQQNNCVANTEILSRLLRTFYVFKKYFEIQTELVKSSKLDLDLGSNLKKSNKTREDFRNREIHMFPNSPAYGNPESGQNWSCLGLAD